MAVITTGESDGGTGDRARPPLMEIEAVARRLAVGVRHVRRLVTERRIPYHNESCAHCAFISSGLVKESSGIGFDLDA